MTNKLLVECVPVDTEEIDQLFAEASLLAAALREHTGPSPEGLDPSRHGFVMGDKIPRSRRTRRRHMQGIPYEVTTGYFLSPSLVEGAGSVGLTHMGDLVWARYPVSPGPVYTLLNVMVDATVLDHDDFGVRAQVGAFREALAELAKLYNIDVIKQISLSNQTLGVKMVSTESETSWATHSEITALQTSAATVAQMMRSKPVPLNAEGQIDVRQPRKLVGWLGFTKAGRVRLEGWALKPFPQMQPLALMLSEAGMIYRGSFETNFAVVGRRVVIFSKLLPLEQLDIDVNALHEIRDLLRQLAEGHGITDLPI